MGYRIVGRIRRNLFGIIISITVPVSLNRQGRELETIIVKNVSINIRLKSFTTRILGINST